MDVFRRLTQRKPLILVVDDERPYVELLLNLLESYGYSTLGVLDGAEAVKQARARHPALVILDISMPNMDGLEALDTLKKDPKTKDIPVLMVSARQAGRDIESAFEKGAVGYIIKPVQTSILRRRIEEILTAKAEPPAA